MSAIHHFTLFLTTGILLNLTPGPDTAYILGRSIVQGRRAGIASALGISIGSIGHTVAAALGLSAFLAASALAFTIVKFVGGAYLIYLGVRMILSRAGELHVPSHFRSGETTAAFRQGIITNLLNPKVALFFLAFLPQFIDPASPMKIPAFIALGLTFVTTGTIWCLILAWFASAFSERLRGSTTVANVLNRTVGSLLRFSRTAPGDLVALTLGLGAHAPCVLVSAPRRNELSSESTAWKIKDVQKLAMARAPSPAREARAVPGFFGNPSLSAGNDANKFNAVSGGKRLVRPFVPMKREPVVLDQHCLRRQIETGNQFLDRARSTRLGVFAIQ